MHKLVFLGFLCGCGSTSKSVPAHVPNAAGDRPVAGTGSGDPPTEPGQNPGRDQDPTAGGPPGYGSGAGSGSGFEYGLDGVGPGGGGTGWGTIGTGAIGHRTPRATGLSSLGLPSVIGDLDKQIIGRYVKRNLMNIQRCWEAELHNRPKLEGTVTAKFTIGADGIVSASSASGMASVETCVAAVIKRIEFPKPSAGKPVQVTYPFVFLQ